MILVHFIIIIIIIIIIVIVIFITEDKRAKRPLTLQYAYTNYTEKSTFKIELTKHKTVLLNISTSKIPKQALPFVVTFFCIQHGEYGYSYQIKDVSTCIIS